MTRALDTGRGNWRLAATVLPVAILWLLLVVNLLASLSFNEGHLMYSLDDPYIHLALAENLLHGHFGLNPGEASAPSSSILWPFLLTLFTPLSAVEWVPLVINAVCATATLLLVSRALLLALRPEGDARILGAVAILGVLAIPAMNLVGLVFTGMEHSLQVLCAVALVHGVVAAQREERVSSWLYFFIVLGPLVRYENAALSAAALAWLFWSGRRRGALISALVLGGCVAAYSALLISLGLSALPTSVLAKSAAVAPEGGLKPVLYGLYHNVSSTPGVLMSLGVIALLGIGFSRTRPLPERRLAWCFAGGLLLHVVIGRFGWFNRYEIYAWSAGLLVLLHLWREPLRAWVSGQALWRTAFFGLLVLVIACREYVIGLGQNVFATNNVYQQQYQLHRFATEFLRAPVAVNDLGWAAWRNDEYVLDLWGLASLEALEARRQFVESAWVGPLAQEHGVRAAMIYEKWFPGLPEEWVRLGELRMGGMRITPADNKVTFFAVDEASAPELHELVERFAQTLPPGAEFVLDEE